VGHVYKELNNREIPESPTYYPKRLILEQCENIHLHYRNLRLEFDTNEFCEMYRCFKEGMKELQAYLLNKAPVQSIALDKIDPYDNGHKKKGDGYDCGPFQHEHEEGVAYVKNLIEQGKRILPIAVVWDEKTKKFKRMDGFKRYWAYKELGKPSIPCYVFDKYIPGIQEDMSEVI
jgi:hypothetical protein